jgi:hypothetical protein
VKPPIPSRTPSTTATAIDRRRVVRLAGAVAAASSAVIGNPCVVRRETSVIEDATGG